MIRPEKLISYPVSPPLTPSRLSPIPCSHRLTPIVRVRMPHTKLSAELTSKSKLTLQIRQRVVRKRDAGESRRDGGRQAYLIKFNLQYEVDIYKGYD